VSAQEASVYALANDARDFGDRIAELLADPERRQQMGQFGRERVATKLAWAYEVPKLVNAYEHAVK